MSTPYHSYSHHREQSSSFELSEAGFIAEIQALRQFIANNHQYDPWTAFTTMKADQKAIAKLRMYCETVFNKDRDARLNALSAIVGRRLQSSVGTRGLTIGEVYGILSWMKWQEELFPAMDPAAEDVMSKLQRNPQKWRPVVNRLGKPELPAYRVPYAEEPETPPF